MTDEPGDEDDRTVYEPKADPPSPKEVSSDGDSKDGGSDKPAQGQVENHEPTRFEKSTTPPTPPLSADAHEPTRFEKPTPPSASDPDAAAPPSPTPPTSSGRKRQFADGEVLNGIYRIKRFIARGGMGEVYEASNIHQQQERVAIKVMLPHLAQDELVTAMFGKEAEMLTRLHHEAIVPYRMAARDANGNPYIVTEYIDGASVENKLGKLALSDEEFAQLAQKLAAGLGTAHNLGAIHRDIAPDNILLAGGDPARPKIIDFGIAKDARENSGTIVGEGFAGKLKYVAPEQLGEYDRNIGPWTDLYSLALTLRAVAAGKHSDMGGSLADAVRKRQGVPDLSAIPARFQPAFEMALQPDPKARPQSMAEFILRLGEPFGEGTGLSIAGGGTTAFPPPPGPAEEKKTQADKPKGPTALNKMGAAFSGLGSAVSSAFSGGLAQNRMLLLGGGAAALLLILVVAVVALNLGGASGGGSSQAAGGSGGSASAGSAQGGQTGLSPDSPEFARLASTAINDIECAWLTFQGGDGGTARFVGGASNPAAAQSKLVAALEKGGAGSFSIDVSDVVRFEAKDCAFVDALRAVRSEQSLITTPRQVYEAEQQELVRSDGRVVTEGALAKVPVRLINIPSSQQVALLQLGIPEGLSVVSPNRSEVEYLVENMKGDLTENGMAMVLGYEFEATKKESSAIFLISSPTAIPTNVLDFNMQFDEGWIDRFAQGAKANNWKVDAVWITVEDKVKENSASNVSNETETDQSD